MAAGPKRRCFSRIAYPAAEAAFPKGLGVQKRMIRHCGLAALAALLGAVADAQSVADRSPEPTLAAIQFRLDYGLWGDRIHALYALGELGPQALPLLSYATEDADWQVRLTAVHFLGKAGPDAAPALAGLARDEPCPFVRISALKWLSGLGDEGRARYAELVTFEDQARLDMLPDRFGTERMGRAITIDPPDGEMTSRFFNGGIDLRVCASSERSGRRHRALTSSSGGPAPDAAPVEPPAPVSLSTEVLAAASPRLQAPAESLPDAQALPERPEPARSIGDSPEPGRRNAELDALLAPTGPAERFPETSAGWSGPLPQTRTDYAAVPERRLAETDLPDHAAGPRERLPQGPALPSREASETASPGLAPDAGIGKPENDPLPVLIARLSLPDPRTRARAADELGQRGAAARQAVRLLRGALKDPDRRVRASAALALGDIGVLGRRVVAGLERALRDPDEDVRFSARLALERLRSRSLRRR